jgi:hypothetical protein
MCAVTTYRLGKTFAEDLTEGLLELVIAKQLSQATVCQAVVALSRRIDCQKPCAPSESEVPIPLGPRTGFRLQVDRRTERNSNTHDRRNANSYRSQLT